MNENEILSTSRLQIKVDVPSRIPDAEVDTRINCSGLTKEGCTFFNEPILLSDESPSTVSYEWTPPRDAFRSNFPTKSRITVFPEYIGEIIKIGGAFCISITFFDKTQIAPNHPLTVTYSI